MTSIKILSWAVSKGTPAPLVRNIHDKTRRLPRTLGGAILGKESRLLHPCWTALTSMTQAPETMDPNPHSKNDTSELSADTVIAGSGGGGKADTARGEREITRLRATVRRERSVFR